MLSPGAKNLKNMKIFKYIIPLFALLLTCNVSIAQEDLPEESVDVIKNFNAVLLNTEKVPVEPKLPPSQKS